MRKQRKRVLSPMENDILLRSENRDPPHSETTAVTKRVYFGATACIRFDDLSR